MSLIWCVCLNFFVLFLIIGNEFSPVQTHTHTHTYEHTQTHWEVYGKVYLWKAKGGKQSAISYRKYFDISSDHEFNSRLWKFSFSWNCNWNFSFFFFSFCFFYIFQMHPFAQPIKLLLSVHIEVKIWMLCVKYMLIHRPDRSNGNLIVLANRTRYQRSDISRTGRRAAFYITHQSWIRIMEHWPVVAKMKLENRRTHVYFKSYWQVRGEEIQWLTTFINSFHPTPTWCSFISHSNDVQALMKNKPATNFPDMKLFHPQSLINFSHNSSFWKDASRLVVRIIHWPPPFAFPIDY